VYLQQTIGHATAAKYPQSTASSASVAGIFHRKIAGQQASLPGTNIQTVKVVE